MKQLCLCTPEQWQKEVSTLGGTAHFLEMDSGHYVVILNTDYVPVPDGWEVLPKLLPNAPAISAAHAKILGVPNTHGPWDVLAELHKQHPLFRP